MCVEDPFLQTQSHMVWLPVLPPGTTQILNIHGNMTPWEVQMVISHTYPLPGKCDVGTSPSCTIDCLQSYSEWCTSCFTPQPYLVSVTDCWAGLSKWAHPTCSAGSSGSLVQSGMVPWGTGATPVVFADGHGDELVTSKSGKKMELN